MESGERQMAHGQEVMWTLRHGNMGLLEDQEVIRGKL